MDKKWISKAPLYQGLNWYSERVVSVQVYIRHFMLPAHKTGSETVSPERPEW